MQAKTDDDAITSSLRQGISRPLVKNDDDDQDDPADLMKLFEQLKTELHTLSEDEVAERFSQFRRVRRGRDGGHGPPPRQQKIDHLVVLFMENRGADHIFGCMLGDQPGK